jgi:HEAT repeat protein
MGEKSARLFRQEMTNEQYSWNIVELESFRQLRQKVNELIELCNNPTYTTNELRYEMRRNVAMYGQSFCAQLVRALHCDDQERRQDVVWLLTILDEQATIPLLESMSANKRFSRPVRLSAAFALAGMGVTAEITDPHQRKYAV